MNAPVFFVAYLGAVVAVCIGAWAVGRLSPAEKGRWLPRLSLAAVVVLGVPVVGYLVAFGQWALAVPAAIFLVGVGVYRIRLLRVCVSCGAMIQPTGILIPGVKCLACGTVFVPTGTPESIP